MLFWKSDPDKTKEDRLQMIKAKRLLKELNDYKKELLESPLKLEISDGGFPLCPGCDEEYKNKEDILEHLRKNKRASNELVRIEPRMSIFYKEKDKTISTAMDEEKSNKT